MIPGLKFSPHTHWYSWLLKHQNISKLVSRSLGLISSELLFCLLRWSSNWSVHFWKNRVLDLKLRPASILTGNTCAWTGCQIFQMSPLAEVIFGMIQIKDLAECLVHSEATQSMSVSIALNVESKGQRQDQDQVSSVLSWWRWVMTGSSGTVTGPVMIHGQGCLDVLPGLKSQSSTTISHWALPF